MIIMLIKRTITSLVLAVIGIPAIILGGIYYFALIVFFLGVAAWEYGRLFCKMDSKVPEVLLIGSVVLVATTRTFFPDTGCSRLNAGHPGCHDLAPVRL